MNAVLAAASGYVFARAAFDDELARLRLLEARYDAHTFRRLSMFGPLAGARCLEVGAGLAPWPAGWPRRPGRRRSSPPTPTPLPGRRRTGRGRGPPPRHPGDPLQPAAYDLVHCRALLLHLADPQQALRNMAAAARPGGG